MRRALAAVLCVALPAGAQTPDPAAPGPVQAQAPAQTQAAPVRSPLLVIEFDVLYAQSAFGLASAARTEAERAALLAENRTLEAALETEERDLTARRATLSAADFRALAEAFDQKAEGIRAAQQAKDRAISDAAQADQARFLQAAAPVLVQLMADSGAVAILDKDTVFLSFDVIDVTARAIPLVDAAIGDGTTVPAPPAP
jgi:Skp family chaperone for outer membrane proteins